MPETETVAPVLKHFSGFEIKDAEKGEVEAKVATLEVIDKDGDIIRKGAQPKAAKVALSAWGHDAVFGQRPAGKGTLVSDGDTLKFSGRYFLNTTNGRESFETLKEMGPDQEWSFGFRVLGWEVPSEAERKAGAVRIITKMDAFEVSPVLIGAGVGTRTMSVKEAGSAEAQADGAGDAELKAIAESVAERVAAAVIAERKAAADLQAETERKAADETAAAELKAADEAQAAVAAAASREFEKFQRTLRKSA